MRNEEYFLSAIEKIETVSNEELSKLLKTAKDFINDKASLKDIVIAHGSARVYMERESWKFPSYDAACACEAIILAIICDDEKTAEYAMSCATTARDLAGKTYDESRRQWVNA